MDPAEIAQQLAQGGGYAELTSRGGAAGANRIFRIWHGGESRVLKVYGAQSRRRREERALEMLAGLPGLPTLLDRGVDGDLHWSLFRDAGQWSLGSLPENQGLAQTAGRILAALHNFEGAAFSNLARGIDQEWVTVDFLSTYRRLERYRGRLNISKELLAAARAVRPPFASQPRVAHTNPAPDNFIVNAGGNVTLIGWEWATMAPPEWDLSRATWLLNLRSGLATARALEQGYGTRLEAAQLDRWTVYHVGMMLVYETENRLAGRLDDLRDLVAELERAVAGSRSAA